MRRCDGEHRPGCPSHTSMTVAPRHGLSLIKWPRRRFAAALGVIAGLVACSDPANPVSPGTEPTLPPTGLVVSDPSPIVESSRLTVGGPQLVAQDTELVYVTLFPGTVPGATSVAIENRANGVQLVVAAADGGIDPVSIAAGPGDTISVVVSYP